MKVFESLVCAVITLIAKKKNLTFRSNTEEQKNGAKNDNPCQSYAPCHFVAVSK